MSPEDDTERCCARIKAAVLVFSCFRVATEKGALDRFAGRRPRCAAVGEDRDPVQARRQRVGLADGISADVFNYSDPSIEFSGDDPIADASRVPLSSSQGPIMLLVGAVARGSAHPLKGTLTLITRSPHTGAGTGRTPSACTLVSAPPHQGHEQGGLSKQATRSFASLAAEQGAAQPPQLRR